MTKTSENNVIPFKPKDEAMWLGTFDAVLVERTGKKFAKHRECVGPTDNILGCHPTLLVPIHKTQTCAETLPCAECGKALTPVGPIWSRQYFGDIR